MRWPLVLIAVGFLIAAVGLYLGVTREEWGFAALLLVIGMGGVGAGAFTMRSGQ